MILAILLAHYIATFQCLYSENWLIPQDDQLDCLLIYSVNQQKLSPITKLTSAMFSLISRLSRTVKLRLCPFLSCPPLFMNTFWCSPFASFTRCCSSCLASLVVSNQILFLTSNRVTRRSITAVSLGQKKLLARSVGQVVSPNRWVAIIVLCSVTITSRLCDFWLLLFQCRLCFWNQINTGRFHRCGTCSCGSLSS